MQPDEDVGCGSKREAGADVVAVFRYILSEWCLHRFWDSFLWALSPWSVFLTTSESYKSENLRFLDPQALAPAPTPLFSSPTAQDPIHPLFTHLRNKLAFQMTYVDCYFAFIHQHKSKGLLPHKHVHWVEWKNLCQHQERLFIVSFQSTRLSVCQSWRLTHKQGITLAKPSYLSRKSLISVGLEIYFGVYGYVFWYRLISTIRYISDDQGIKQISGKYPVFPYSLSKNCFPTRKKKQTQCAVNFAFKTPSTPSRRIPSLSLSITFGSP